MNWRCRFGLHAWRYGWPFSLVIPSSFEYCSRCMKGRVQDINATWHYTPEQTKKFILDDMRSRGAEIVP